MIGVPVLLAHAGLRLSTTRLTLRGANLEAHPGFPSRDPEIIAYSAISGLKLRRGLTGRLTGAGSLVITRETEAPLVIAGLVDPDQAVEEIARRKELLGGKDESR